MHPADRGEQGGALGQGDQQGVEGEGQQPVAQVLGGQGRHGRQAWPAARDG
jgi:hypothetical protein